MPTPTFQHLNLDWNADPNAPDEEVRAAGSEVELSFRLEESWVRPGAIVSSVRPAEGGRRSRLMFSNCSAWRLGNENDHGWYMGQCRYSHSAPRWGQFYELVGEDPLRLAPPDWQTPPVVGAGDRHFLFYLRDSTFECLAAAWRLERQ